MKEKFPNQIENELINDLTNLFNKHNIKFTKQKFERGIKFFVKQDFTRITLHIYNVSDGGKG